MEDYNDPTPHATITPEQAVDVLQTVTEGVTEFMRCYDSPESRRLVSALHTANNLVRATQVGACGRCREDEEFGGKAEEFA
jgi:hypothetical protein